MVCDAILKAIFSNALSLPATFIEDKYLHRITFHSISNTNSSQMSAKTISLFDTCVKMNVNVDKIPKKRHWKAFACLLFFILGKRLFKDNVNKACHMHLPYFYLLHGILQLRKELTRRGFKNMLKITKKNIQGKIIKTISFSFSFSILQLF